MDEDRRHTFAARFAEGVATGSLSGDLGERDRRYWKISAGLRGSNWAEFREASEIGVGWHPVNLRILAPSSLGDLREKLGPEVRGPVPAQLWKFLSMRPGDRLCVYAQRTILALGAVTGEYTFREDRDYPHRRAVRWESLQPFSIDALSDDLKRKPQGRATVIELEPEEFSEIEELVRESVVTGVNDAGVAGVKSAEIDVGSLLTSYLVQRGLHYTPFQLAAFYTALQTKGLVILSGISGTGKSKLAQSFADLFPQPAGRASGGGSSPAGNHLFVPVRPDWRDSRCLLGYFNPLTRTYEWTEFLSFLVRAAEDYRHGERIAWFAILDEMNLARVEYYFADLLSVLESGRDGDGWTCEPLRLSCPADAEGDLPPPELYLPPSVYVIGTVNVDETTHAFSPKVLDRAFTIELTEADFIAYEPGAATRESTPDGPVAHALLRRFTAGGAFAVVDKAAVAKVFVEHPEVRSRLATLNALLRDDELHFGYRVLDEIAVFIARAQDNGLFEPLGGLEAAFDAVVLMKVLPKFHGSRDRLERPLRNVLAWCLQPDDPGHGAVREMLEANREPVDLAEHLAALEYRLPATARRAARMLRSLYLDGFAAFS